MFFMVRVCRGFVRPKKSEAKRYAIFPLLAALSVVQVLLIESVHRGSFRSFLHWLWLEPEIFILNTVLALASVLFFTGILGSFCLGLIASTICLVFLSVVSTVKKQFLGEPLLPWDYNRLNQVVDLIPKYAAEVIVSVILLAVFTFLFRFAVRIWLPHRHLNKSARMLLLGGVILFAYGLYSYLTHVSADRTHISLTVLNPAADQAPTDKLSAELAEPEADVTVQHGADHGLLLGLALNLKQMAIGQPENYTHESVARIITDNVKAYGVPPQLSAQPLPVKPNVIVIVSEAFWDPTRMPNIRFTDDPIPNFRALSREHTSGSLLSPVFGGSTANAEYEFLTGMNIKYLPDGAIIYDHFIKREIPSLARVFVENGYAATAIHPYRDWFYKRDQVYPLLGFDRFLSMNDFVEPEINGDYISDLEVSRKIIEQCANTLSPQFVFAVTMQNHAPYTARRYAQLDIGIDGNLSPQGKEILGTYVQGLKSTDLALKHLVDYFNQAQEPTIICFFGDHLPYLGKDYLVYEQTGYIPKDMAQWSPSDHLKMKDIPFIIWTNYDSAARQDLSMGMCYLGAFLLETARIEPSPVFKTARNTFDVLPVVTKTVTINNGYRIRDNQNDPADLEHDNAIIQYDILFGQGYYRQLLNFEGEGIK